MPRKINKRKKLQAARLAAEKKAAEKGKRKLVGIIGHASAGLTMAALLAHSLRETDHD